MIKTYTIPLMFLNNLNKTLIRIPLRDINQVFFRQHSMDIQYLFRKLGQYGFSGEIIKNIQLSFKKTNMTLD